MRKIGFLAALLALSACSQVESSLEENAQVNLDELKVACRDGVEYLVSPWGASSQVATPHLKPDGKPYTCEAKK